MEQTEKKSTLILSQDFGYLARCLSAALQDEQEPLKKQWIFVPTLSLKQWLPLQLAKQSPSGGIAGKTIVLLSEMMKKTFPQTPSKLEMLGIIYSEIDGFVPFQNREEKLLLSKTLSSLFFTYGSYGAPMQEGWQKELFAKVKRKLPIHFLNESPFFDLNGSSAHFFGFDHLPPIVWNHLFKGDRSFFYMFSPCSEFWGDVMTSREERSLLKKKGTSLQEVEKYVSETPPLLRSLGQLGRRTWKELDSFPVDLLPAYAPLHEKTTLGSLQKEIVTFKKGLSSKRDRSIEVFCTGSSPLNQTEALKDEVLFLNNQGVSFSDMIVLAPDIEVFRSLIEFVFGESGLPYRFPQVSVKNAPYYQGICRLIDLGTCWERSNMMALFETSAFRHRNPQHLSWIDQIFQNEDWRIGAQQLLRESLTLFPGPAKETIGDFDQFEQLLETISSLHQDLTFDQELSFQDWGLLLEKITEKYLIQNFETDLDSAFISTFSMRLEHLKKMKVPGVFPFEVIEAFLVQPHHTSERGSHVHAVTCASITQGSVVPASAIFFIGMDEESFPRKKETTSLDLVKSAPDSSEEDRYLFLQAILNTRDYLRFFYGHISGMDGKEVSPSLPLQELLSYKGEIIPLNITKTGAKEWKGTVQFSLEVPPPLEKKEDLTLSVQEMLSFSRHPWRYFLKEERGIYLKETGEPSFAMRQAGLVMNSLFWELGPVFSSKKDAYPGMFEEAFFTHIGEKRVQIKEQIERFGKKIDSLSLLQTAGRKERPPIELELENGQKVKIIGQVPYCLTDGALYFGTDTLSSLLRVWPEILVANVTLSSQKIYLLKTGKIKEIKDPLDALKKYVEYFLRCRKGLTPLIPDWADQMLRKRKGEFNPSLEDRLNQWVFFRLQMPQDFQNWNWLRESFASLVDLYPSRGDSL